MKKLLIIAAAFIATSASAFNPTRQPYSCVIEAKVVSPRSGQPTDNVRHINLKHIVTISVNSKNYFSASVGSSYSDYYVEDTAAVVTKFAYCNSVK